VCRSAPFKWSRDHVVADRGRFRLAALPDRLASMSRDQRGADRLPRAREAAPARRASMEPRPRGRGNRRPDSPFRRTQGNASMEPRPVVADRRFEAPASDQLVASMEPRPRWSRIVPNWQSDLAQHSFNGAATTWSRNRCRLLLRRRVI